MTEQLKRCAHCGGEAEFKRLTGKATIRCKECGIGVSKSIHPGIYLSWEKQEDAETKLAVMAWNRRPQEVSA